MTDPIRHWRDFVLDKLGEMEVSTSVGRAYSAQWRRVGLGPIDVHRLVTSPMRTVRSSDVVARAPLPGYALMLIRHGVATLRHGEHRQRLDPDYFVLLGGQAACDLTQIEHAEVVTVHFPDDWLRRWVARPEQMVGRALSGRTSWGRPLASLLTTIAEEPLPMAGLPRSVIADQCGALFALMSGECSAFAAQHQDELLTTLRRTLQMRFHETTLNPAEVAESLGISKRHLHGVFAAAGTTFATTLFEFRLAAARERLSTLRHRYDSVGDIAGDCGFGDPSHFARRFRARFGIYPTEFRSTIAHASQRPR